MTTLVDGLGFEELGDAGDTGSKPSQLWITGSIVSQSDIQAGGNISGTGSVVGGIIHTANGALNSSIISQAANVFGMTVVAGSLLTDDGGVGVADFQAADFANANYMFVATARDFTLPASGGINLLASGTRRASGLSVLGPSGTVFDWIAVGQR